jgi:hypothetical protein
MQDPRTQGFNYGQGWGSSPKPPLYFDGMRRAQFLNAEATQKQAEAWALEMVLRDVRLATSDEEKQAAVSALTDAMSKYHNQLAAE